MKLPFKLRGTRDIDLALSGPADEHLPGVEMLLFDLIAMLFIHPMWDSETERIGKKKCTPTGYALHAISEGIGYAGIMMLIQLPLFLLWKWFAGTFDSRHHLWLIAVPFILGGISQVLMKLSWLLAARKNFRYDYDRRESSWIESGATRTYSSVQRQA